VILRNLRINGIGSNGASIRYTSGAALHVENCNIFNFNSNGINVVTSAASALYVNNTFLTDNGNGIQVAPTAAFARAMLVQVRAQTNSGSGFLLYPSGDGGTTLIDDSSALGNGTGIGVNAGQIYLSNSVILRNNVGVAITSGTVRSYKDNVIHANAGGDGTPLIGIPFTIPA
jgi:hypothetical protein